MYVELGVGGSKPLSPVPTVEPSLFLACRVGGVRSRGKDAPEGPVEEG
jgi:hypothetical protein